MIPVATPVKHDLLDTRFNRPTGYQLADQLRCFGFVFAFHLAAQFAVDGRGRHQGMSGDIINYLNIDIGQAAEYIQTRPFRRA